MGPFLFLRLRWMNVSAGLGFSAGVAVHDEALPSSVACDEARLSEPPQPLPVEQHAPQVAAGKETHETKDDAQVVKEKHAVDIGQCPVCSLDNLVCLSESLGLLFVSWIHAVP